MLITLPHETERLARLVAAQSGKAPEDVLKEGVEMEARIAGIAIAETPSRARKSILSGRARLHGALPPARCLISVCRRRFSNTPGTSRMIAVDSSAQSHGGTI